MACLGKEKLTLRVLVITGSCPPMRCGVGDYSYNLAKAIASTAGTRVGILTTKFGCESPPAGNGIEIFPVMERWALSEASKVVRIIQQWSPDIVHIQYPSQGYAGAMLPWFLPLITYFLRKKVVQTWHEQCAGGDVLKLFFRFIVPGGLVVVRPRYKDGLGFFLRWGLWNKRVRFIQNASSIPRIDLDHVAKNELRRKYLKGQKRLIVFFGFVHPNKGVELLFDIAEPALDQIVIAGEIDTGSEYYREIMRRSSTDPWVQKVTVTGFLPSSEVAGLLAVADAVILPFRQGGGEWNTSIHSVICQGTLAITTSEFRNGYDEFSNVYYAKTDDVSEMRTALETYVGRRRGCTTETDKNEWLQIAAEHCSFYEHLLPRVG